MISISNIFISIDNFITSLLNLTDRITEIQKSSMSFLKICLWFNKAATRIILTIKESLRLKKTNLIAVYQLEMVLKLQVIKHPTQNLLANLVNPSLLEVICQKEALQKDLEVLGQRMRWEDMMSPLP